MGLRRVPVIRLGRSESGLPGWVGQTLLAGQDLIGNQAIGEVDADLAVVADASAAEDAEHGLDVRGDRRVRAWIWVVAA